MTGEIILKLEDVALAPGGKRLFDGFSLVVRAGEVVCLTGESGCGKTSLLRAVAGFGPVGEGRIVVDGCELTAETVEGIRKGMAYVPQDFYPPCEWGRELVELTWGLKVNRLGRLSHEELMEWWNVLGLEEELYEQRLASLSGGQRQRIVLSLAAVRGKRLLLADEPTSALDGENADRVADFLHRMAARGMAVLVVSHDGRLASACDRVVRLEMKEAKV